MQQSQEFTALVTDDNFHIREIFRTVLERTGYVVSDAEDGSKCLKILENQTFDLLVLDLHMPMMSGLEVLKNLRSDDRHKDLRIVVATAEPRMVTNVVEQLADFVVVKPFNLQQVQQLVERIKESL